MFGGKPVRRLGLIVDESSLDIPAFKRRASERGGGPSAIAADDTAERRRSAGYPGFFTQAGGISADGRRRRLACAGAGESSRAVCAAEARICPPRWRAHRSRNRDGAGYLSSADERHLLRRIAGVVDDGQASAVSGGRGQLA